MKCKEARKLISPYVDDELGQADRQGFMSHIVTCAWCKEELAQARALSQMFGSAGRFSAPEGFVARVMAGAEEGHAPGFWRIASFRPIFQRAVEVAFALIIVTIGIISGRMLVADRTAPVMVAELRNSFYLEVFEPAPPDSIGAIYASMAGVKNER